jgi:hypothetical protein
MGGCNAKVGSKYVMEKGNRATGFEVSPYGGGALASAGSSNSLLAKRGAASMERRGSTATLSQSPSISERSPSMGQPSVGMVVERQASSNTMERRGSSTNMQMGAQPNMVRRGSSLSGIAVQGPSAKGTLPIKVNSSHQWLLKEASIPAHLMEHVEDVRVLGSGLMGTVRLARWRYTDRNLYFALKCINKEYILKHKDTRHVNNERDILRSLSSPFIIRLFGTSQDDENIYYMLEYSAGGELFHRLMKKSSFPAEVAKFYASEIFCALEHVQDRGFIYRDLKPENVMLDANGHCKLVDFGFSTTPNRHGQCKTNCGTPAYLSPEQLNGKFTNGYTKVVDWWSFGCLIFELMTGLTPFCKNFSDSAPEIYMRVLKGSISFPSSFDKNTKDFIKNLLRSDMQTRLTDPDRIKREPYFNFGNCTWADVEARTVHPPFVPKIKDEGDSYYFDDARRDRNPRKPFKKNQGVNCMNYFHGF